MLKYAALRMLVLSLAVSIAARCWAAAPPIAGQKAPDFQLTNVLGKKVALSSVLGKGPVVLIVLRGYPGYQCPFCTKQVHDFVQHSQAFADAGTRVVMVYPGPPAQLADRANEFLKDANFPQRFEMLLDPGYAFTEQYGLRWEGPNETSYPSTFILDREGNVIWETIGKEHGGRTTAATVLDALPKN